MDQAKLMQGHYTFRQIVESGRHLFSTPFTNQEGYGEGPNGPRMSHQSVYSAPGFRYLRLNGLDAQSCFECHFTIGSDHRFDTEGEALSRKVGVMGGAGGIAANVFNNPSFPDPLTRFIRNPPHVFGTGYVQQLAEEMSLELMAELDAGRLTAMANPGTPTTVPLESKGVDFGSVDVTYTAKRNESADIPGILTKDATGTFSVDYTNLAGVSRDLVVRGLQWKGIASNMRNFERDAMNFHFGIQPEELFYELVGGTVVISATDADGDGVANEMSPGNLSAVTVFALSIRPPARQIPEGLEATVARGESIFKGEAEVIPPGAQTCASCHRPTLHMNNTMARVIDPTDPENQAKVLDSSPGLSPSRVASKDLPTVRRYRGILRSLDNASLEPKSLVFRVLEAARDKGMNPSGYSFDLTEMPDALPLSFPRLPEDASGEVDVPLFSDLKRHRMGSALADVADQGTDAAGIMVPAEEFLTRPLWGVGDTAPYLHDGRAPTLQEAILLHRSTGSEANDAIDLFDALSEADQEAMITFLLTLRLAEETTFTVGTKSGWRIR